MEDFDTPIKKLVYPILINAYKTKSCLDVYYAIGKSASELKKIDKKEEYWGLIQNLALNSAVINIYKIFDQSSKKYKKHTLFEIIEFIRNDKNISEKLTWWINNNRTFVSGILEGLGFGSKEELLNYASKKEEFLNVLYNKIVEVVESKSFKKIKKTRDKDIAHQEYIESYWLKQEIKTLPSVSEFEKIINFAVSFCNCLLIYCEGGTLYNGSKSMFSTTQRKIAKDLGIVDN
jgi:hypothetical protein